MSSLKDRISAPLEAGASILDAQHLPPHVDAALQYVSKRLARKDLHITLVVMRREPDELPVLTSHSVSIAAEAAAAAAESISESTDEDDASFPSPPPTAASAPARTSRMSLAFKQLVRSNTQPVLPSQKKRKATKALKRSASDGDAGSRVRRAVVVPPLPMIPSLSAIPAIPAIPAMPVTPAPTDSSASSTDGPSAQQKQQQPQGPNPYGIHLVHTEELDARAERLLRQTIAKAERRFEIGSDWLPQAVDPSQRGLAVDSPLIRRSVLQNEALFSADGLTLLSLDRLYTFKRALAAYSRTDCAYRLEDAVDELRRCVLANGRRRLPRSQLLRVYPNLTYAENSLREVSRMYRRAYGGPSGDSGIECDGLSFCPIQEAEDAAAAASGVLPPLSASPPVIPVLSCLGASATTPAAGEAASTGSNRSASCGICDDDDDLVTMSQVGSVARTGRLSVSSSSSSASARRRSNGLAAPPAVVAPPLPIPTVVVAPASPQSKSTPVLKLQTTFGGFGGIVSNGSGSGSGSGSSGVSSGVSIKTPRLLMAEDDWKRIGIAIGGEEFDDHNDGDEDDQADEDVDGSGDVTGSEIIGIGFDHDDDDDEDYDYYDGDGDLTARPSDLPPQLPPWAGAPGALSFIDEVLLSPQGAAAAGGRLSDQFLGPLTPHGYDDVSPITRNEWEFLMVADAWKARTAAVETW